jgi:hypothetical protein
MSFSAKTASKRQNSAENGMSDSVFQEAYTRVRARHTDQAWFALTPREIADSIYQEIRLIDRERLECAETDSASMPIAAE